MKPTVRYMTHEDIGMVVAGDRVCLGHSLGEETYHFELDDNPFAHYFVLVDEESNKFLGMISLWVDTPKAQIINLYIMPEYQGLKLATILLDFTDDYLVSFEIDEITLEVRVTNQKAILIYEKHGFKQVAIRKQYYDNGEDAYLMLKRM